MVLASMIFTNSYLDLVQIAAIVGIVIWQPNQFVHDLAPLFVIKTVESSFVYLFHICTTNTIKFLWPDSKFPDPRKNIRIQICIDSVLSYVFSFVRCGFLARVRVF